MSENSNSQNNLYVLYDEMRKKYLLGNNKYVSQKKYAKLFTSTEAANKIDELKDEGIDLVMQCFGEE